MSSSKSINKNAFYEIFHRDLKKRYSYFFTSFIFLKRNCPHSGQEFQYPIHCKSMLDFTVSVFCQFSYWIRLEIVGRVKMHLENLLYNRSQYTLNLGLPFTILTVFSDQKTCTILFKVSNHKLLESQTTLQGKKNKTEVMIWTVIFSIFWEMFTGLDFFPRINTCWHVKSTEEPSLPSQYLLLEEVVP